MKKSKNPKAFISYLQTIDNAYKNLEVYNPTKKKVLKVFERQKILLSSHNLISKYLKLYD